MARNIDGEKISFSSVTISVAVFSTKMLIKFKLNQKCFVKFQIRTKSEKQFLEQKKVLSKKIDDWLKLKNAKKNIFGEQFGENK
jgi:hypothetical protein